MILTAEEQRRMTRDQKISYAVYTLAKDNGFTLNANSESGVINYPMYRTTQGTIRTLHDLQGTFGKGEDEKPILRAKKETDNEIREASYRHA